MSAEHTPGPCGPWHYVNRYSPKCAAGKQSVAWTITDRPAVWTDGGLVAAEGDPDELRVIADTRDVRDEGVARLIAAAPDLLAALRMAERVFSVAFDGSVGSLAPCHDEREAIKAARAAIAKATGH